jgi:hypothetical protein
MTDNTMATRKRDRGQAIQWPHEIGTTTANTMATRKRDKGETIQWPHERGTMDKQYNGHTKEGQRTSNNLQSLAQKTTLVLFYFVSRKFYIL